MPPSPLTTDSQVAPILKAHEKQLVEQVPSYLKEAIPESASQIFSDYTKTGDPTLKKKAGDAINSLGAFVARIPKTILGESEYNAPTSNTGRVNNSILDTIQSKENAPGDASAIRHNRNGTRDYGLMQINTINLPLVQAEFKKRGRVFNPLDGNDSRLAAEILLMDNSKRFQQSVGRVPNDMELIASYHTGITQAIKDAKSKEIRKEPTLGDRYMKASIFHGN